MPSEFDSSSTTPTSQQIEDLFCEAISIAPAMRNNLIQDRCGQDLQLMEFVKKLVSDHQRNEDSGFILDQPVLQRDARPNTFDDGPNAEGPGDIIGRYRLLEKIGEGGMGIVYMAEPLEGVNRRVALKVIKLGMDTRQVIARFEVERQAMAMFDHSNITRVFDAGATATGRPYFVMELVHGTDIVSFVTENGLELRERLGLFESVCHAIQHSHQKGIIHRDLKPSNILVTLIDGLPTPKVIDFGIAKALDQRLTNKTLFTHYAAIMGTPQYMSPEQVELSGTDIDTRSDIYSLGVLLYELVTGSTPFEKSVVERLHPLEILNKIRQQNIETPSMRLAKTETQSLLSRFGTSAALEKCGLELDSIVMKALDRDRTNRYQSATELAADIRRFQNGDPVEAVAPTRFYRLRNYVVRNRKTVVAASAVGLLLFLSSIICSAFAFDTYRANRAKDQTVEKLSDALSELNLKHNRLILAEKQIREAAEYQSYSTALELADRKIHWIFYNEIRTLLPTYLRKSDVVPHEAGEKRVKRNAMILQSVPRGYLDYKVLFDLKHRRLVDDEITRLESISNLIHNETTLVDELPDTNEIDVTELKTILDQKAAACRPQYFRAILHEYRNVFGAQDPRVANALNLLGAALIEVERIEEAEAHLREALAISDKNTTDESTRQLLKLCHENSSYDSVSN